MVLVRRSMSFGLAPDTNYLGNRQFVSKLYKKRIVDRGKLIQLLLGVWLLVSFAAYLAQFQELVPAILAVLGI